MFLYISTYILRFEMKKIFVIISIGIVCLLISGILYVYAENSYEEAELIRIEFNEIQNET